MVLFEMLVRGKRGVPVTSTAEGINSLDLMVGATFVGAFTAMLVPAVASAAAGKIVGGV